jgi:hypothetical protein
VALADTPTITDWMQGWGTVLGMLVSSGALVFTGLLLRHETRIRRDEQADGERSQARLIIPRLHSHDIRRDPELGLTAVKWLIENHSTAPIMAVLIRVYPKGATDRGKFLKAKYVLSSNTKEQGWWQLPEPVPWPPEATDDNPPLWLLSIDARFIDANGLEWERTRLQPPQRLLGESRVYSKADNVSDSSQSPLG